MACRDLSVGFFAYVFAAPAQFLVPRSAEDALPAFLGRLQQQRDALGISDVQASTLI